MKLYIATCAFLVCVLSVTLTEAKRCTQTNDCPCGDLCTSSGLNVQTCPEGAQCTCRTGCAVADVFIPAGKTKTAYCNRCSCSNSSTSKSVPACTRAAWCDLPEGIPLYPNNRDCLT